MHSLLKILTLCCLLCVVTAEATPIRSTISAKEISLTTKGEKPFPRSYCIVRIPSDDYDFRLNFAGKNIKVDWGDGTKGTYVSTPAQHTFAAGEYDIEIDSKCTRFESPVDNGRKTIIEVGFGPNVTSIADAGYQNATSLVTIACAPSVATAVNHTFAGCMSLDWVCDFPILNTGQRESFLPTPSRQFSHIGRFSSQQSGWPIYGQIIGACSQDLCDMMPSITDTYFPGIVTVVNYHIRRVSLPSITFISRDAFYILPNLYAVYSPKCQQINSCLTRRSSSMNNNPLGVTHLRLGHLNTNYTPSYSRTLCWGGNEKYLGVFMVDMTRTELADWLSTLSVANFISQSAFT